jgi:hypothetical protein
MSEGNMGTNGKHFNGIPTAYADGGAPDFRPEVFSPIRYCPVPGGYRQPPFERVSTIATWSRIG